MGMFGAERFFLDRQGALVERLRLAVTALGLVRPRQVVNQISMRRVIGSEFSLA